MSSIQLKSGPYTVDDLYALQDDKRYEIYDGEIQRVPPPALTHQRACKALYRRLDRFVSDRNLGDVYFAPVTLILSDTDYVEPDLVYVSGARRDILTDRGIDGCPDLVVEVLSPSTKHRDLSVKSKIYARFGVPHCWILDPSRHELVAFELRDGELAEVSRRGGDQTFEPGLFEGLQIDVGDLWFRTGES